MNRAELRQLAQDRIEDARILLDHGRWQAAYYLADYAVECGLKACIMAYVERTGVIFVDKKFAERCWTHDFFALVVQADLKQQWDLAVGMNAAFLGYWGIAGSWTERSRYESKTEFEARSLYEAITHADGVFPWIQTHW